MLGKGHSALLRRAELKTFMDFHGNEAGKGGDLTHDETTIIAGALEMTLKTAKDAMTPISKAFSLDLDATLTLDTMNEIMTKGHSRVPVYHGNPTNIIGLILVKNILSVDHRDAVPVRKMIIRKIPRVSEDVPLYDILNEFQKGHSHLAVVYKDLNETKDEARLEFRDSCRKPRGKPETLRKDLKEDGLSSTTQSSGIKLNSEDAQSPAAIQVKKIPSTIPSFKKRHQGCSYCILDIENNPVPEFPSDEEVVGVITMEDVIEELLQEEILDETDEYVNIHNRIRVNMHPSQEKLPSLNSTQPSSKDHSPTSSPLAAEGLGRSSSAPHSQATTGSPTHTLPVSTYASVMDPSASTTHQVFEEDSKDK